MSYFSEILSKFIIERNVKVYALAQYCNMDRANTYKIISGKRNPSSLTYVNKMADFLQLTFLEREKFIEAYEITSVGEDTYFRRKKVQKFLQTFARKKEGKDVFQRIAINKERAEIENITGKYDIIQLICDLFRMESEKLSSDIRLMIKTETDEVAGVLRRLVKEHKNVFVEQLFCIDNNETDISEKYEYNLSVLEQAVSNYECSRNYHPYYYYDRIRTHISDFNLLSSVIITTDYAFSFSVDLEYGILYHNAETVQQFQEIFEQLKYQTQPLIWEEDMSLMKEKMREIIQNTKEKVILFEKNPFFFCSSPNDQMTFLISERGIKELDVKKRKKFLIDLQNQKIHDTYKMLCIEPEFSEGIIAIVSSVSVGCMILENREGRRFFLNLNESGLQQAFYDYLINIDEKYICSGNKLLEYVVLGIKKVSTKLDTDCRKKEKKV